MTGRPSDGRFGRHHSEEPGKHADMRLTDSKIRGTVTVMGDEQHQERIEGMGSALQRLARAREQRGPVGVLEPAADETQLEFDDTPRSLATGLPRASQRRGLFRFSDRARTAADEV